MNRRSLQLDYSGVKTYSAEERINLVRIDNLKRPGVYEVPAWGNADFDELVERIKKAKQNGSQIIFSMGAHVIKCGLSPYLIALMKEGRDWTESKENDEKIAALLIKYGVRKINVVK